MTKELRFLTGPASCIRLLVCITILLFSFTAQAQNVTGHVTTADNLPLAGVTVGVKGTSRATTTNNSGNFEIKASGSDVLVFTSVGYAGKEVPVGALSAVNVSLTQDSRSLNEVIVTALGIN